MLVHDLRSDPGPIPNLASASPLALHLALVVECATVRPKPGPTHMPCRFRDLQRSCPGVIGVFAHPDRIEWSCLRCGDGGIVLHWADTRWDLRGCALDEGDATNDIPFPTDELRALRELELPRALRAQLAIAPTIDATRSILILSDDELLTLANAAMTGTIRNRKQQRRADRAAGRLDALAGAIEIAPPGVRH